MDEETERSAEYRQTMREALLTQHAAVYCALTHKPAGNPAHELAAFMLREAGWDRATFLSAVTARLGDA